MCDFDGGPDTVYPALIDGASFRESKSESSVWMLEHPDGRNFRVSEDFVLIASMLDGFADAQSVAAAAPKGHRWSVGDVAKVAQTIESMGVDGAGLDASKPIRRLRMASLFRIQYDLWLPKSVPGYIQKACGVLWSPTIILIQMLVATCGLTAVPFFGENLVASLAAETTFPTMIAVLLCTWGSFAIHEICHAGALISQNGKPKKFGIMLFFFLPALYCDVTDIWLLKKRQRGLVILAGIFSQYILSGLFAIWGILGGPTQFCALIVCSLLFACTVNLIPFIKLDGYLLVAAMTDIPFLQDKSIAAFMNSCASLAGGITPEENASWLKYYGLFSIITPVYITIIVLNNLMASLSSWGLIGSLIITFLIIYCLGIMIDKVAKIVAMSLPGPRARIGVPVFISGMAALTIMIALIPTTAQVQVSFRSNSSDESYIFYSPLDRELVGSSPSEVQLTTNGILLKEKTGSGITSGISTSVVEDLFAVLPVSMEPVEANMIKQSLLIKEGDVSSSSGVATLQGKTEPLIANLFHRIWRIDS